MKTTALLILITVTSLAADWVPQGTMLDKPGSTSLSGPATGRVIIHGFVNALTPNGLLVKVRGSEVLLTGFSAKQGTTITVPATKVSPASVASPNGVMRMVECYQAAK